MTLTPEQGRAMGKRSGLARQKLTIVDVEAGLGRLESPGDAQRWAKQAFVWAASGLIPGTVANACASLMREWRAALELQVDLSLIAKLERRGKELEAELAAARAAGATR